MYRDVKRGNYAAIYRALWTDPDFQALTKDEKIVFLNLRTGPLSEVAGIGLFYLDAIVDHTRLPRKSIERALRSLERASWIASEGHLLWVRNALLYEPGYTPNNLNHQKGMVNYLSGLPKSRLLWQFIVYYTQTHAILKPIEKVLEGLPNAIHDAIPQPNRIKEKEKEKEKDINGENEGHGEGHYVEIKPEHLQELHRLIQKNHKISLKPKDLDKWIDCLEKLERMDGYPVEVVIRIVDYISEHDFWNQQLQSILKLRRTNKDGRKWIDVFADLAAKAGVSVKPVTSIECIECHTTYEIEFEDKVPDQESWTCRECRATRAINQSA